jgi:hypothetical protein
MRASVASVEPVARLDLDRGHALGDHSPQARHWRAVFKRLVLAGQARRLHGGADAAAGARDLLVARPPGAPRTPWRVAAEDQVGVAVDQAGRDPGVVQVVLGLDARRQLGGQARQRPHPDDAAVADQHRAVLDQRAPGLGAVERGEPRIAVKTQAVHAVKLPCST